MESANFSTLIHHARAGDECAATKLVRDFEPALRRQIRMILTNPWIRRTCDTSDLLQSVLGDFFVRLAAGQFNLDCPENLKKLLKTMAVNRVRNLARSSSTKKRTENPAPAAPALDPTASDLIAKRDLVARVRELLSDVERQIADLRTSGLSWEQVAAETGGTAEAIRKQFARAMHRVGLQFDIDDFNV